VQRIAERYERSADLGDGDYEDEGAGGAGEVMQQGRLPSVKDPKLWMVKCKHGQEKAVTVALMRKCLEMEYSDKPLQIKSVIAVDSIKGYIYVEAYSQNHVQHAIRGLQALALGQRRQELVPIDEMTTVLKCVKRVEVLPAGTWVRLKRTMYKDDLAQVVSYDESRGIATVKLLPRLDYEAIAARERNDAVCPPPALDG
jgi:transcription elongation factor SPT5